MKTIKRPDYFHRFTVVDPGVRNFTGILLAYTDFLEDRIVVENEALLQGEDANTTNIADTIHRLERETWNGHDGGHEIQRYSDVELRLIMDLRRDHALAFQAVKKKDPDGETRAWRAAIQGGRFLVNARCERLIDQMRNAVLNTKGTDLALESNGGHYDLIACGRYLVKYADTRKNPYPAGWRVNRSQDVSTARPRDPGPRDRGLMPDTPIGNMILQRDKKIMNAPNWLKRLNFRR